jgi:hypothetical protein
VGDSRSPWQRGSDRPQQRRRQVRQPRFQRLVQSVAVSLQKMQQSDDPGLMFHQGADRGALVLADDEIAFRKTEDGPGGSGVAEIALRQVAYWECPPDSPGRPGC